MPEDDRLFVANPDYAMMFNMTYTFKQGSTVVLPYGGVVEKSPDHGSVDIDFENKNRDILWMVSHCHTSSRREVFVEELRYSTK